MLIRLYEHMASEEKRKIVGQQRVSTWDRRDRMAMAD